MAWWLELVYSCCFIFLSPFWTHCHNCVHFMLPISITLYMCTHVVLILLLYYISSLFNNMITVQDFFLAKHYISSGKTRDEVKSYKTFLEKNSQNIYSCTMLCSKNPRQLSRTISWNRWQADTFIDCLRGHLKKKNSSMRSLLKNILLYDFHPCSPKPYPIENLAKIKYAKALSKRGIGEGLERCCLIPSTKCLLLWQYKS